MPFVHACLWVTWYEKIGSDHIRSEWTLSTAFLSAMCTVFGQQEKTESQLKNPSWNVGAWGGSGRFQVDKGLVKIKLVQVCVEKERRGGSGADHLVPDQHDSTATSLTHTHVDQNKSIKRYTLTTILLLLYWPSTILYPARLHWAVIRPQRAEIEVWHVALTGVVSEPGGKLGGQRSIAAKSNLWSRQPSSGSSRAATFISSQSSSRNIKTNCWSNSEQKAWRQRHHNQWDH